MSSPKKTFTQQVASLFRGQVLYAISQFAILAMLSRFGGDEESGMYILALATTAPIFMFCDLNLRVARSTDQQYDEQFSSYLGLRLWCVLIASAVSLAVAYWLFSSRFMIFLVITIYRFGDSLSNLSFGQFQRAQQSDLVGKSLSLKGPISILAVVIIALCFGSTAVMVAIGMALIALIFGLLLDLPKAWSLATTETLNASDALKAMGEHKACFRIAKRALPLGFDASISSLAFNMPSYFIEATLGTGTLGVFGVLLKLAYSFQMLVGAVGHTGVSVLAKLRAEEKAEQFWRLLKRMTITSIVIGFLAAIGGSLVIPTGIGWLLGSNYNQTALMMILLVASCMTGTQRTAGRATQACSQYFAYTMFDVVIFLVSFIASAVLVKQFGLFGGGMALAIAYGLGLVVTLIHTHWFLWPNENSDIPKASNENLSNAGSTP